MDIPAIEAALQQALPNCELEIQADGNKLGLQIICDEFAGLSRVKRQQKVYSILDERIKSGEIHAVSMVTQTTQEAGN